MDLEAREVRRPDEGRKIVDDDVANVGAGCFAARYGNSFDPRGSESRGIFLVERIAENTFRKALEGNRTILKMGEEKLRNANVIIDYLRLRELLARVKDFVEVGNRYAPAPNY